jgi:hypothetical protein
MGHSFLSYLKIRLAKRRKKAPSWPFLTYVSQSSFWVRVPSLARMGTEFAKSRSSHGHFAATPGIVLYRRIGE